MAIFSGIIPPQPDSFLPLESCLEELLPWLEKIDSEGVVLYGSGNDVPMKNITPDYLNQWFRSLEHNAVGEYRRNPEDNEMVYRLFGHEVILKFRWPIPEALVLKFRMKRKTIVRSVPLEISF